MLGFMHPIRLFVCFVLAAALGYAADTSDKAGAKANRSVKVTGLVSNPGTVEFPPARGLTITEAISLAGGQTRLADLREVILTRTEADGGRHARTVDIDAIMKAQGAGNVALKPGDTIFVPPRNT